MANPAPYSDTTNQASGLVWMPVKFTAGASGALPALSAFAQHNGLAAAAKPSGTGIYTLTLEEPYLDLVDFSAKIKQASYSSSGACNVEITADATSGQTRLLTLLVTTSAGAAVNLASGDVVILMLCLQYMNCQ